VGFKGFTDGRDIIVRDGLAGGWVDAANAGKEGAIVVA
jgi:hypothetical protein